MIIFSVYLFCIYNLTNLKYWIDSLSGVDSIFYFTTSNLVLPLYVRSTNVRTFILCYFLYVIFTMFILFINNSHNYFVVVYTRYCPLTIVHTYTYLNAITINDIFQYDIIVVLRYDFLLI